MEELKREIKSTEDDLNYMLSSVEEKTKYLSLLTEIQKKLINYKGEIPYKYMRFIIEIMKILDKISNKKGSTSFYTNCLTHEEVSENSKEIKKVVKDVLGLDIKLENITDIDDSDYDDVLVKII
jgi:hypothetical protein